MAITRWQSRLRKAREAMGLSLQGAANLLKETEGISLDRTMLQKLESGRCDIPTAKFRAICKMYDVSPSWILGLKE